MLEGSWKIEAMREGGETFEPIEGSSLTMEFVDGRVAGSAGVNRYMGGPGEDKLFGPLAMTLMAGPPPLMEQEQRLMRLLERADSLVFRPGNLELIADGDVVVVLIPAGTEPEEQNVE